MTSLLISCICVVIVMETNYVLGRSIYCPPGSYARSDIGCWDCTDCTQSGRSTDTKCSNDRRSVHGQHDAVCGGCLPGYYNPELFKTVEIHLNEAPCLPCSNTLHFEPQCKRNISENGSTSDLLTTQLATLATQEDWMSTTTTLAPHLNTVTCVHNHVLLVCFASIVVVWEGFRWLLLKCVSHLRTKIAPREYGYKTQNLEIEESKASEIYDFEQKKTFEEQQLKLKKLSSDINMMWVGKDI